MKKIFIIIAIIVVIIVGLGFWYLSSKTNYSVIQEENKEYEAYKDQNVYGLDVATVINKAVDRNTKNKIEKDDKGYFIQNDKNSIEVEKIYKSPYYISGKLLSYNQVGDTLYFSRNYGTVNVLYKGLLVDDEGLPQLTDKEALAIATYLAYVTKYKEGLQTNNGALLQQAQLLEAKWLKQCDQARVTKLSQNDLNDILNVKDSWGRHSYGFSYKPIHK